MIDADSGANLTAELVRVGPGSINSTDDVIVSATSSGSSGSQQTFLGGAVNAAYQFVDNMSYAYYIRVTPEGNTVFLSARTQVRVDEL
jgi:hypothetical protein